MKRVIKNFFNKSWKDLTVILVVTMCINAFVVGFLQGFKLSDEVILFIVSPGLILFFGSAAAMLVKLIKMLNE